MAKGDTIAQIIMERILERVEEDQCLPWMKPFLASKMNWFTEYEYSGVNKIMLRGFEYVTGRNIETYNEKHKTDFAPMPNVPDEVVIFKAKKEVKVKDKKLIERWRAGERSLDTRGFFEKKGEVYKRYSIRRYTQVYDIRYVQDSKGNKLEPKLGKTHVETFTDAQLIIDNYMKVSGVRLKDDSTAYYIGPTDTVYSPPNEYYQSMESYYRTLYHEFAHSTGIKTRLDRDCYAKYHDPKDRKKENRSREELVAEMAALFIASEAGFRDDSFWAWNSANYIESWVSWMKTYPEELLKGIREAEKAKNYILKGIDDETFKDNDSDSDD